MTGPSSALKFRIDYNVVILIFYFLQIIANAGCTNCPLDDASRYRVGTQIKAVITKIHNEYWTVDISVEALATNTWKFLKNSTRENRNKRKFELEY